MKVVILAGGFGTRISEESYLRPKPMIEVGGQPLLWHIMKTYSYFGFNEFVICCGYRADVIKDFFQNYYIYHSDVTYGFKENKVTIHNNNAEPWTVTVVDTGLTTMTGGRVKRVSEYIGNETFMLTYGDGLCDVDIKKLYEFHKAHGRIATLTAIQPGSRFGVLEINDNNDHVRSFTEKKIEDGGWINGGYMVLEPEILNLIQGDETVLEKEPLEGVAATDNLVAYRHNGFWKCMDTLRDKNQLEEMISQGNTPWMRWNN